MDLLVTVSVKSDSIIETEKKQRLIMLNAVMLRVHMLYVILLNIIMQTVTECRNTNYHYTESHCTAFPYV
jgi:hypothetical protein